MRLFFTDRKNVLSSIRGPREELEKELLVREYVCVDCKKTINPMLFCLFCLVMFRKDYKPNAFPAFLLFRRFAVPPPAAPSTLRGRGAGGRGYTGPKTL